MKALIVDDERLARKELRNLLESMNSVEVIGECANADEAISSIEELNPELVFMDIQMPGKTGFDVLEELECVPEVVFVTAYDDFAIKAFEVNALDYLLKPIDPIRLEEAVVKVSDRLKLLQEEDENTGQLGQHDHIFLKDGDKCWFVKLATIRYFESEGNYVRVHFENNKPLILRSLNNLEKRLENKTFFRANRKFIVNLHWIEKADPWFNGGLKVELKDGTKIEISRRQAAKLKEVMSL